MKRSSVGATICGISSVASFVLAVGWVVYSVRWSIGDVHGWEPVAGFAFALLGLGAATLVGAVAGGIGVWLKAPLTRADG